MTTRLRRAAARAASSPGVHDWILAALGELGGAVLVLDPELRVLGASPEAVAMLGGEPPVGVSAPRFLCGESLDRPIAEALAAGRPVTATVTRPAPGADATRRLRVRTVPLRAPGDPRRAPPGWLLLLDAEAAAATDAAVEFHGMWTRDPAMKQLFHVVTKVAATDASVLVRGETGAGKELVALAIHALSPRGAPAPGGASALPARAPGPFRAINCAALPPALLESELFGHVRGAFTGAVRDNPGHFRLAHGGTLFLDEVAELPLELQAKLLRVLETRTVIPVGAREPVPVDVRIVSATHRALRREVEAGRFRADLMFRLRVVPIYLPPLRARAGDVSLLAERFVEELSQRGGGGRKVARISPGARAALERYDWPGNVRELRNALEYAFVIGEGPMLVEADLPPELRGGGESDEGPPRANQPPAPPDAVSRLAPEAERIWRALERAGGSRERAAKSLGISRVTLWRKMRALGLDAAGR